VTVDPFNPETWKHQWEAFVTAPYVLMPLVVLALVVGWWIGNKLAASRVEGLNGAIENLKANIDALRARLDLAADREKAVQLARAELEKQVAELKAQIAAGVSNEKLIATSAKVDMAITQFSTANNALATVLTARNLTTGSPEFGRPNLTERSN
jgi:hypothetical protein